MTSVAEGAVAVVELLEDMAFVILNVEPFHTQTAVFAVLLVAVLVDARRILLAKGPHAFL